MFNNIKKIIYILSLALIFNFMLRINVFAEVISNASELSPLDKFLNFCNYFYAKYGTILLVIGGIVLLSLLDAFYCFVVKAKEQGKYLKDLSLERERYNIVVEQLNDIIFDFDLTEKKMLSSSKFEEKFGWNLNIQKYNKNFFNEFKIHPEDKTLLNKIFDDMKAFNKQSIIKQIRLMKKNGEYLWCEMKLNYIQRNGKIVRVIGKISDIDHIVKEFSLLKLKSEYDQLTELYNKTTFYDKVKNYIKEHKESTCTLIFIDLDNFKAVNDNLGHMTGDEVIKDTANKIIDVFNEQDAIVSRFGGDEFCVFNPSLSIPLIKEKIKLLCENLNAKYIGNNIEVRVSASIGIAFYPSDGKTLEALIEKSDVALYESKEKGKNQFTIYNKKLEVS
ncbi:diguanylate cyclase (GGDEF)-like protein/PAS domain S-box-containing protein [Clostridium saccharoperbutylacetonicum]|uniref:Diguanylate cyclase n=1 Tax=Clostridium saccharoperbutylacetonicum N1-4(HMT) TaxID=931276 RepID=M1N377_9CLOT|nr:diguanylate cyclase [Clostridium saccharoperbutylacetonicum]AGF57902.1 diguanylate cyclase [Clostridium saccharoperbutylacetonicum N1-4(HMT)]NRT61325.1 diguanylate cyclase (GGDEF)-like protein/PAS domain S-box-containing protein [Clostridium saccharoperbutylacetonicum]NSB24642.1 diguanylate cyclase (GGDEF)-like protein/PAS domain S-box-containing protein [Clostridium saccharoperbutylacetonicum]NSB44017.1 diguanylate cyclase (GGDEF)-like protein/PAS domain S-box-containing protein [Clostridiu